jgi:hypothetical protein
MSKDTDFTRGTDNPMAQTFLYGAPDHHFFIANYIFSGIMLNSKLSFRRIWLPTRGQNLFSV